MKLATIESSVAGARWKDVIKAHDEGRKIQYKVSHRRGYEDYAEEDYPIHFINAMGISYKIKPGQ